jgi:hypothetical protein
VSVQQIEDYLSHGEELLLSWIASSVKKGDHDNSFGFGVSNSEFTFGATDRRIVYLNENGNFKDIDYNHISSIETDTEPNPPAAATGAGCCGGILVLAGLGGFSDDPGAALLWLSIGIVLFVAAYYLFKNHDGTEKRKIKLITGDEAHQQITFTTSEDVGASLSQIVREQE